MRNPRIVQRSATGIAVAVVFAAFAYVTFSASSSRAEKIPSAVDSTQYANFIDNEVWDAEDLAEGAEIQRRMFNRMTPPNFSWLQPMFPSVMPFDAANFTESFLDGLLGEDKNSVAIYPLSLVLDPKTRETLVYNAEGKLIVALPSDKITRTWPKDADPARVTLLLDLLPSEDVEPYLYTESRVDEFFASDTGKSIKSSGPSKRSLGASDYGICNIQKLTNGNMRLTVTNGVDVAEVYAYTVLHTASVVVVTWTNEQSNVVTETNTLWTPVSPSFDGIESAWESSESNLVLSGGVGVWDDSNISSNDRVRFYATAKRGDADKDELTDGAEIFLHRTDMSDYDTDGDSLLDGYNIVLDELDPRYDQWANSGIIYVENSRIRTFKGELSAGSDPLNEDTDGDTLPDGWEVQNDVDPTDDGTTNSDNGATGNPDGDEFDNRLEYDLGAPANNSAWNGNELAYQLMHATEDVVTNTRSITTNLIGMRVIVVDSADCPGGTAGTQDVYDPYSVPTLLECGYYIDISIAGLVEDVDTNYDEVSFQAFTNTPYFEGHYNRPTECRMVGDSAMRNVLIMGNSTVNLRYNTVSYKWHSGAYAEIMQATNTGPYKVVIGGDSKICEGETTSMSASGGGGPSYTWSASGDISVNSTGDVTGISYGYGTVTATDYNGCTGEKKILVLKTDIGTVGPLADRTLHPDAARKPLLLKQTLPADWNGLMELSLSGAVAYWTSTGGVPIASGAVFTNSQLSQTIYLEGSVCGTGLVSFSIDGPPSCGTNTPLQVFGVNATLDGVAEADEVSPGGFIVDHTAHTNAPRTELTLDACGPTNATGNLTLAWNSSQVRIYTVATGGTALSQFIEPFNGFNGTNLYVEGISPGSNTLSWSYSGQSDCEDSILLTVVEVEFQRDGNCSGFDDTLTPPWIMAPVNDTNTALAVIDPSGAASRVNLLSVDTGKATVLPSSASTSPQIVSVTGVSHGNTSIQSKLPSPYSVCAILNVAAKSRIDKTIAIHAITEENDDIQVIPIGQGQPNQICITSGTNGVINSSTNGDDVATSGTVTTGPNGICETSASGDDLQVIAVGNGKANAVGIVSGTNAFRDTSSISGDDAIIGDNINAGVDGICSTVANAVNLIPMNVPSAATLQDYLNNSTWGKQANIHFSVSRFDSVINYDLNRDANLADPWAFSTTWAEIDVITSTAQVSSVDYNIYYVKNYEYPVALSDPQRGEAWVGDLHSGSTVYVSAHEIGHLLGRVGHFGARVGIELMGNTDSSASPCQIIITDWDYVNP